METLGLPKSRTISGFARERLISTILPKRHRALARGVLQSLVACTYLGRRVHCPCCGWSFRRFLSFGVRPRPNAMCPRCHSLERHRLLWLYLTRATGLFSPRQRKVLHIAPEPMLEPRFRSASYLHYVTVDLHSPRAMCRVDIAYLPFRSNAFDVIICYHVLEHVAEDQRAMRELFRVLKPDGWALLQSPVDLNRETTYEDPSIVSPHEREKVFGQADHVRIYGRDYRDRLEEAGFNVRLDGFVRTLPAELVRRSGVLVDEDIYVCTKAA